MSEDSLSDMRRKNTEERKDEMPMLSDLIIALADRDSFPSKKLLKVKDKSNQVTAYQFEFANPWYVGEPVSTVQTATVIINGKSIGSEHLTLVIRDQEIHIDVAKTLHEIWWGFAEVACFSIKGSAIGALPDGQLVDMNLHFDMRTTINYGVKDNLVQYVLNKKLEVESI